MRALIAIFVVGLAAAPAVADPVAPPAKKKPKAEKKQKARSKPAATPGVDLGSMARAAAGASGETPVDKEARTPNGARRLDLTPARLFGKGTPGGFDRKGAEQGSGFSLGDDKSWVTQAAQVGVMAVGFAALVALCGGGRCMLNDVLPSNSEGPSADLEIRPASEPRSARPER